MARSEFTSEKRKLSVLKLQAAAAIADVFDKDSPDQNRAHLPSSTLWMIWKRCSGDEKVG